MDTWGLLGQALECSVCLEQLDTTSRVLPCQHTFCRKCLVDIINTRKELRCPECRVLVTVPFNSLPPNILLLRILEGIKSIPNAHTSSDQPDPTNQSNSQSQPGTDPFSIFCNVNDSFSSDGQTSNVSDRSNEVSSQISSNNPFFQPNINLSNVGVNNDPSIPTTQTVPHSNNSIAPDTHSQLNGVLSGPVQPSSTTNSVNQLIDGSESILSLSSSNRNSLLSGTMTLSSPVSQAQRSEGGVVNSRGLECSTDILSYAQPSISTSELNNLSNTMPSASRMHCVNLQIDSSSSNDQRNEFQTSESVQGSKRDESPLINIRLNFARQLSSKSLRESQSYIPPLNLQAKALYNYNGKEARDLKFKKGDTITITKQIDENWYQGELDGHVGIVPSSYIKFLDCSSSHIPQCKALYDFKMVSEEERNCLMFSKGDTITILRRIDENWAEGKLNTHIGIFPFSFVELNEAARTLLRLSGSVPSSSITPTTTGPNSSLSTVSSSNNSAPISSILSPVPVHTTSQQPVQIHPSNRTTQPTNQNCIPEFQSCPSLPSWTSLQSTSRLCGAPASANICASPSKPSPTSDRSKKSDAGRPQSHSDVEGRGISFNLATLENLQLYIAMHSYQPKKADELELKKGLLYSVADKCQDGWFKGRCLSTDKIGVFPGNYVQIADAQAISSALSPRYSSVNIASYISDIRRDNLGLNRAKCSSPQSQSGSLGDVRNLNGVSGPPELPPRSTASSAKNATTLSRNHNPTLERPASASEISTRVSSPISHQGDKKSSSKDRSVSNGGGISLIRTLRSGGKKSTKSPPLLSLDNPVFDVVSTNKVKIVACDNNAKNSDTMKSTKQPAPLVKERYKCIVPYPANSTSELELQLGDIVYVYKKREDGWFKGTHQRTGKTGLFPSIFVQSY